MLSADLHFIKLGAAEKVFSKLVLVVSACEGGAACGGKHILNEVQRKGPRQAGKRSKPRLSGLKVNARQHHGVGHVVGHTGGGVDRGTKCNTFGSNTSTG